jgi:hypothetical protein
MGASKPEHQKFAEKLRTWKYKTGFMTAARLKAFC